MDTILIMGDNVSKNLIYRGSLKQLAGYFQGAIDDFDKALSMDGKLKDGYVKRGIAKVELGRYEAAIVDFDAGIGASRGLDSIAYRYRGHANNRLGLYGNALEDYNAALKYNASDVELISEKSAIYMTLGENDKALDLIEIALRIEKNYIDSFTRNSILLGGSFQNLERLLKLALEYQTFHPEDAQNNLNIGYIYVKMKQPESALKNLNAVTGELTNSYDLNFYKGMAYFYILDNRHAIEHFEVAISKRPDTGLSYVYMADCYKALGDKTKACESLQRASSRGVLGAQEIFDANCR
jgi:tetratricopeptide (TPR) repeat protein